MSNSFAVDFPVTTGNVYLNTATMGILPRSTVEELQNEYGKFLTKVPAPSIYENDFEAKTEEARRIFAPWIGAHADEVSFQPSSSTSLNLIVSMLAPKEGENVVVDDLGFPSGTFPAMALQPRGVEVRWARNTDGLIRAQDYEKLLDEKTRLVVVSLVSWVNGLRAEVEEIAKMAHERGASIAVDSTHGTGYLPIDVKRWDTDFLVTSNYKWLLGTHGATELYCPRSKLEELQPPHLGWHSTPHGGGYELSAESFKVDSTARRFEPGNPDYISIITLSKSLDYLEGVGRERVATRTLRLSRMVNEGLRRIGMEVLTPDEEEHRSGIVFAYTRARSGPEIAQRLSEEGITVVARSYHGLSGIRVSPYFYNEEADVERFLESVRAIVTRQD
jgi:selenocysteine lyase/cysteine desulfurase